MKKLEYKNIYQELPPKLKETDTVSLDLELAGLRENQLHRPAGRFLSLACSFDGENAYIIFDDTQIQEFLNRISPATWIFHNSVFDIGHLRRWAKVEERKNMRDTLLIERLMWSNYYSDFKLSDLVRRYLKCYMPKDIRTEFHDLEGKMTWEQIEYASLDVIGTWLVDKEQQKIVDKQAMVIWNSMYNPHVWTTLELGGFKIDVEKWKKLTEDNQKIVDEIELDLGNQYGKLTKKMSGRGKNKVEVEEFIPFNPASPAQVLKVLKERGMDLESTSDDALRPYYEQDQFVKNILDYRKSAKLVSTYGLEFLKYVEDDGRIYTSLNISLAETGRDSSSSPNLQNIPKTKERRACFIAGEGNVLVLYDYSGQEACIFAYITGDPLFKEIINSGKKLYIEVARLAFDEVIEKDTPRYDTVKALILGMFFGLTAWGFARDNNMEFEEAEEMYNRIFETFVVAGAWIKSQQSRNLGITKTILGRKCHVHPYDWQWKNNQLNNPMQGSASDMIKIAMKKFRKTDFYKNWFPRNRVFFVLQVHDEVIMEVESSIAEEGAQVLKQCMIETAELIHPGIKGNVSGGIIENWAEKG